MTTEERKTQLAVSVDATEADQGFAKIVAGGRNMAQQVSQAGQQAAQGIDAIGNAAEGPAAKIDKSTRSMIASVQRATAAAEAAGKSGSAFYESLANQRGANLDVLRPYLDQLDAVTKKQMDAKIAMAQGTEGLNTMGMSAKATAAAMRGVPAQFTDIITSLQGGQAPMTVLLQQGGQLKDMFGGIGNASKALGGYIVGLVNPMTLLAAAAGGVAYAYYKGSQEADAYSKALILGGNAAGTTSGQLSTMAASISKVTGTQSAAAAALAEMAQSSGAGRDNLEAFTRAAVKFESTTGTAVSETVKQFKELAKSPVEASLKLNETMNFLTASVYRQIKALHDQGKATEAAELAQKVFADTLDTRSAQMVGNIGTIESAWKEVTKVIKNAGDAMLNIGRIQTPSMQLAEVSAKIAVAEGQDKNRPFAMPWDTSLTDLRAQQASLQEMIRLEKRGAEAAAERAASTQAVAEWDKTGVKYLSDKVKMEQDIAAAKNLGIAAGESQAKIEERIKAIRESYNKKGSKEGNPFAADQEYAKEYAKAWEDFTKIGEAAAGKTDDLSKAQERLVGYLKSPAYANHSAAMREIVLQSAYGAIASEKLAAEHKKQAAVMKESADAAFANSDAIYKSMVATEDKLRSQQQENETIGMTAVQIARLVKARDLEAASALDAKAALYEQAGAREEDIDGIKRTADALRKLADARLDGAVKKQDQADWMTFFTSIDNAAHTVWTNVLQGGQDIWSKLRNTAKTIFFDWLYQMTLKKWIFSIGATVSGSGAMAQTAGSSVGGIGSIVSTGKAIYNSVMGDNGWLSNFGGASSNMVNNIGGKLYNAGFEEVGATLIDNASTIGSAMNTMGEGLGYLNSVIAISKGKWGEGIGSAIGTYFGGPIGAMIGAKIGSWVDNLTGNTGTKPSIEGGFSTAGNPGTNGRAYTVGADGMYYGGALDSSTDPKAFTAKAIVQGGANDYNAIVKASGYTGGTFTSQAFMGIDGNGGSKGSQNKLDYVSYLNGQQVYNRFSDLGTNNAGNTDAAMTDAAKESTTKAVLSALAATDLGPQLNKYLDAVKINGASLAEVTASLGDVTNYISFSNAVKNLPFDYLTGVSVETTKALFTAAGGLDKFGTNLSTYFELFGTQAEKQAAQTGNLSDGFKALGITMPKATEGLREWYKSEVARLGAMDLSIQANADAYNSALLLAEGVNALATAEEQAAATKQSWQDRLDLQSGAKTQDQLDMQRDLASATDDTTKSMIAQWYTQKALKQSTDELVAAQKAAAATRQSWQDQLDVLNGTSTQEEINLRRDLASTTDEGTQALMRQVYAERGLQKARSEALAAMQRAKEEAEAARTAAISAAKDSFDRAVNAERDRLNTLLSQKQATYDTVKGVFDLLTSSVKDLYAQVASTAAMSAAQGNAYISTALALSKSGGVVPDQAQLADAIGAVRASIDSTQYSSQFEADRARLILAGQLSQLKDNAGDQLTAAERALNIAKDQLTALDELVQSMADMIDAANGIDTSIKSVGAAFAQLAATLATAIKPAGTASAIDTKTSANKAGGTASTSGATFGGGSGAAAAQAAAPYNYATGIGLGGSINTAVADPAAFVKALDWGNPAAVEKSVATTADFYQQNGLSQADIARDLNLPLSTVQESMDLRGIPRFAIGTNYVPRDMFAQIHEGEAIVPKAYNPWASPGGYNNGGELVSAIRALGSRLANIESHTQATADATNTVATIESDRQMQPQLMQVVS